MGKEVLIGKVTGRDARKGRAVLQRPWVQGSRITGMVAATQTLDVFMVKRRMLVLPTCIMRLGA